MYRVLFVFMVLLSQVSFAQSNPVGDVKDKAVEARSCVKGFATASQMLGKDQYKGADNMAALTLVETVCTTDNLVVSFYTAQKRSPDAKTLDEIKRVVEGMVRDWYKEDVEVLKIAEKRAHQ